MHGFFIVPYIPLVTVKKRPYVQVCDAHACAVQGLIFLALCRTAYFRLPVFGQILSRGINKLLGAPHTGHLAGGSSLSLISPQPRHTQCFLPGAGGG